MAKKEPLLFLCHRIPFPPNKGDKIRSFNILKALSEEFDVYLGSFVDDPFDWQYAETLNDYCVQTKLLNQNKLWCKIKGLTAFLSGKPISLPYYGSGEMQRWVDQTLADVGMKNVFIYSSVMAQFTESHQHLSLNEVVDFVDVDSDKWRQYAEGKRGLSSWIYSREYRTLQRFENSVAARAQHSLFVSGPEAELFKKQVDSSLHERISGMLNGVDTAFFDPQAPTEPDKMDGVDVVFTGAMDYWANVDAVLWFAKHVWPLVRQSLPTASFYVVGGNPTSEVSALDGKHGIVVTGRVKDVRPYIRDAKVTVAPLQIARGIQNKVIEALSMAKPVIATTMAIEGIDARTEHVHITDDPRATAAKVCEYIQAEQNAPMNRQWVVDHLQWNATLAQLPQLFANDTGTAS